MFDPGNFTPHYVINLCHALSEQGVDVSLITSVPYFERLPHTGRYPNHNLFFRTFASRLGRSRLLRRHPRLRYVLKGLSYPIGLWRTWRELKDRPPAILHAQWALLPVLDTLLFTALKKRGWRIVYTAHDLLPQTASRMNKWQFRRLYQLADVLIVHAEAPADKLTRTAGVPREKIQVVKHGNLGVFCAADLEPAEARHALDLDADGPLLLFFGLIKPYKGLEYLLQAMPLVLRGSPRVRLLIAGEPMESFARYQKLIARLGIGGAVVLRLGYVPLQQLPVYFCAADLVVLPHVHTAMSGVLRFAFGYARPVVVTSVGGLPEAVEDGHTGFVVPPRSPKALAEAIGRGLRDPARLIEMGREARRIRREHYSWDKVARRTIELYEALGPGNAAEPPANAIPA